MLREKKEKAVWVQFARPKGSIWDRKTLWNFQELFWSVRAD